MHFFSVVRRLCHARGFGAPFFLGEGVPLRRNGERAFPRRLGCASAMEGYPHSTSGFHRWFELHGGGPTATAWAAWRCRNRHMGVFNPTRRAAGTV